MARTSRTRTPIQATRSLATLPLIARLAAEPGVCRAGWIAALLGVALFASGINYPLVFGDFAALDSAKLKNALERAPAIGAEWLGAASFGLSTRIFGQAWPWHRAINIALHAVNVLLAYVVLRRVCAIAPARAPQRIAPAWIAAFAAACFAVHPVAVFAVAYLSAREHLLVALGSLLVLVGVLSASRENRQWSLPACVLGCVVALLSGPRAIGIAIAALLVAAFAATERHEKQRVLPVIGVAVLLCGAYALALLWNTPESVPSGPQGSYIGAIGVAGLRLIGYLVFWFLPVPAWLAIDIPEPVSAVNSFWLRGMAIMAIGVIAMLIGATALKHSLASWRSITLPCGIVLALYLPELLWPRLTAPFALAQSYPTMMFVCLVPFVVVARFPIHIAAGTSCVLVLAVLIAAGSVLNTFASHSRLWDAAVRRAELFGTSAEDARVYLNRAAVHRREGHTLAAIADYDKALALQPDSPRALRGRAQMYIDEKRYDDAMRDLDRLLELEPAQAITHADKGMVLLQLGRYEQAGTAFDIALKAGVEEPRVYLNRGLARFQLSGFDGAQDALADIEKALERDPSYAIAYFNRGRIFLAAADAGVRLRDAASPEIMRAVAAQNILRACELGYAPACARAKDKSIRDSMPGGRDAPITITPEDLRKQGLPPLKK
jgi:tetratricopeptide (TPR) repeat protein